MVVTVDRDRHRDDLDVELVDDVGGDLAARVGDDADPLRLAPVSGHGEGRSQALTSAIRAIKPNHPYFTAFIQQTKLKMKAYYNQECDNIQREAKTLKKMQEYEAALALLFSVPGVTDCYETAQKEATKVYLAYQDQQCAEWTQRGRAFLENNQYAAALDILSRVDPMSSCAPEVSGMLARAGEEVDSDFQREWNALQERFRTNVGLEVMRIGAIRDIATAYYQRPQNTNLFIIR